MAQKERGPMPQRLHTDKPFFGCVDREGHWFDSSESFEIAAHWCCYYAGAYDLGPEQEVQWMSENGKKLGLSIVHSDMLRKMWDAGLLK